LEQKLLLYLLLTPLAGSILSYLFSLLYPRLSGVIATLAAALSGICATLLYRMLGETPITLTLWDWFTFFGDPVRFEFVFDRLAAVMCLVITWVGSAIHLYSVGYMAEDESEGRFFSFLNLFLFAMLILVLGSSLPMMFIGWEGVGLCSYLLIGFWFDNEQFTAAGQKAFIVNRVGDIGFLLAMFLIAQAGLSLNFVELESGIGLPPTELVNLIALALFLAAAGKSAQLPLFVWLPDAMAGPTPVSALIHAATMVTAGVYLFARVHFVLDFAPLAQDFILIIGTLTAFIAATAALVQRDIKKVLAYSTVSQLGFMFMAIGAGAYSVAMFHVVTHAFFKALLFLSAGAVIYGCHHEQTFEKFGGLWRKMPMTFLMYLTGTLAISGIPFFSGAVSKDLILENMYLAGSEIPYARMTVGELCWVIAIFTAGLTAFYMFRSLILTFFGKYRGEHEPHEAPAIMLVPLILLAIPSAIFGELFGDSLLHYLEGWRGLNPEMSLEFRHALEGPVLISALSGVVLAILIFAFLPSILKWGQLRFAEDRSYFERAWGFDEMYYDLIARPLSAMSLFLTKFIDRGVVDGTVSGTAHMVEATGELVSRTHTGRVGQFIPAMLISFFCLVTFILLIR